MNAPIKTPAPDRPAPHSLVYIVLPGIYLRVRTHEALKKQAAATGKSVNVLLREAVERGVWGAR